MFRRLMPRCHLFHHTGSHYTIKWLSIFFRLAGGSCFPFLRREVKVNKSKVKVNVNPKVYAKVNAKVNPKVCAKVYAKAN